MNKKTISLSLLLITSFGTMAFAEGREINKELSLKGAKEIMEKAPKETLQKTGGWTEKANENSKCNKAAPKS